MLSMQESIICEIFFSIKFSLQKVEREFTKKFISKGKKRFEIIYL